MQWWPHKKKLVVEDVASPSQDCWQIYLTSSSQPLSWARLLPPPRQNVEDQVRHLAQWDFIGWAIVCKGHERFNLFTHHSWSGISKYCRNMKWVCSWLVHLFFPYLQFLPMLFEQDSPFCLVKLQALSSKCKWKRVSPLCQKMCWRHNTHTALDLWMLIVWPRYENDKVNMTVWGTLEHPTFPTTMECLGLSRLQQHVRCNDN